MCALCWRETVVSRKRNFAASYFCIRHIAGGNTNSIHLADKRKLLKAVERKGFVVPDSLSRTEYYDHLYVLPYKFIIDPKTAFTSKVFPRYGTNNQIGFIVKIISVCYPKVIERLKLSGSHEALALKTSDLTSFTESFLSLIALQSGSQPIPTFLTRALDYSSELWAENLIEHVARYEAFAEINNFVSGFATRIGRPPDETSRNDVETMASEMLKKTGKVKQKEIAEELNLSAARVSQLFKNIGIT